jgi:hypothetical protein
MSSAAPALTANSGEIPPVGGSALAWAPPALACAGGQEQKHHQHQPQPALACAAAPDAAAAVAPPVGAGALAGAASIGE